MNVAFIPVRGGSKSIPLKNIKLLCGKPLVYWTVKAACSCKNIDKVYIATDSVKIKDTVIGFMNEDDMPFHEKIEVIGRSEGSASDTASTESAMLEFASAYEFDNIALIQATSPLLTSDDLEMGFEKYFEEDTDSVLSVVRQKRFNWQIGSDGFSRPMNYDYLNRPRRQDFEGYFVENGAFYITSKKQLLSSRCRISGNIKSVEMDEDTFFEIDEPSDWVIIEALIKKRMVVQKGLLEIKMLLTDCDGCLTDGGMYYSENGDELKKFNTRDGMAFSFLRENGIKVGMITGENRELNRRRAEKLQLDYIIQGCTDKLSAIRSLCDKTGIPIGSVAYIGDDINDLNAIMAVGLGCCPSDAVDEVRAAADLVTRTKGGGGVVREVAEFLLGNRLRINR